MIKLLDKIEIIIKIKNNYIFVFNMNHFDLLPQELLHNVIYYLKDEEDINKLLRSSSNLKILLSDEAFWKNMFYSNVTNPEIDNNKLWISNYFTNIDIRKKYNIKETEDYGDDDYIVIFSLDDRIFNDEIIDNINHDIAEVQFISDGTKQKTTDYTIPNDIDKINKMLNILFDFKNNTYIILGTTYIHKADLLRYFEDNDIFPQRTRYAIFGHDVSFQIDKLNISVIYAPIIRSM